MVAAMRPGGGKQKGASFEREVCVLLSKWVSEGKCEDVFWRSAMSGGRATVAHKKGGKRLANQAGDISCIHPLGYRFLNEFAAECKFYSKLNYEGLLTGKGKLLDFWTEINYQADCHEKLPFLICRQNRMPAHVCLNKAGMRKLLLPDSRMTLISVKYDMYIIQATSFVIICKPFA